MHRFNFYDMLVPDLMHEIELGVWKSIFTHLARVLYTVSNDAVAILNSQYIIISIYMHLGSELSSRH